MDEKELTSVPEETGESTDATAEVHEETPSASDDGGKKKKKKHRYPFWKRLLIFLLGTIIGFVSCIGAIAGVGYWAYSNLSLQKLNEMGIAVSLPDSLQGTGEVDISTYTIKSLIGDVLYFTGDAGKEKLSIQGLRERYGLRLFSDVEGMLPAELVTLPLADLAGGNGFEQLLSALDFSFILKLLPEGVFSEPFIETMEGRDLGGLASGNMGDMLADVKLGYLIGANYEKQGDDWVMIPADPAHKTLMEYMAELDLGEVIGETQDENGSVLALLKEELGTIPLSEIMGFASEGGDILEGVFFGDVIVKNETDGTYSFQIAAAFNDRLFGTLAGYEERADGWYDDAGNKATVLMASLFDYSVGDFASGEFNFNDIMSGLVVGDLMGYTKKANGGFLDESGKDVTGLNAILADVSLDTLINGELAFDTLFDDEKVGTVLNYTQDKRGNWYDESGNQVTGLTASIANITMQQFFGKESLNATDVFAGVYLGEVMGYTVAKYKTDGKTPDKWIDADGKEVDNLNADVANLKVGDLSDGKGIDFKEVFGNELIGDMQGYTYNAAEDLWYNDAGEALGSLENAIANMSVAEIIDGNIDFTEAFGDERIGDLQNYTYYGGKWYKDAAKTQPLSAVDNVIAGWTLSDVMDGKINYKDSMKDVYVGELMGYSGSVGNWRDGTKKVTGLSAAVADLKFGELDSSMDFKETFGDEVIGEIQGYTYNETKKHWYTADGKELEAFPNAIADMTIAELFDGELDFAKVFGNEKIGNLQNYTYSGGKWYKDAAKTQPLSTLDSVIANWSVSDVMDGKVDYKDSMKDVYVGELMGYSGSAGNWQDGGAKVTGLSAVVADLKFSDLDNGMDFEKIFGDEKIGEMQGYTYNAGSDQWYDADGKALGSFENTVSSMTFSELMEGDIDFSKAFGDDKIGDLQEYTYANGQWYKDAAKTQPLSALDNVIASWSLNEVMDGTVDYKASMKDVYLGELMGYTGSVGNWRDGNEKVIGLSAVVADLKFGELDNDKSVTEVLSHAKVGDVMGYHREGTEWYDEKGNEVTTILALLADKKVEEMNDTINGWQLGHLMGYEKRAGGWYNPDGDVNDMMVHVADLYLSDLSNPDAIHASIDEMHMSDILNYTQGADGYWYHGTERVTGVTAYLAGHAVKDLPNDMNEMTVADVFGYEKTAGVWYDADGHKLDRVMVSIAETKIVELDDRLQTITVEELFEHSDDGFFKIIGGKTKLSDLDDRLDVVFGTGAEAATIGDFMDAGIIDDVDAAESAKLDRYLGTSDWRNMQVTTFINNVISIITTLP